VGLQVRHPLFPPTPGSPCPPRHACAGPSVQAAAAPRAPESRAQPFTNKLTRPAPCRRPTLHRRCQARASSRYPLLPPAPCDAPPTPPPPPAPARYLPNYPRLLYLRRTLIEYNALFGGQMEPWVRDNGPEALFPSDKALDAAGAAAAAAAATPRAAAVDASLLPEAERARQQQVARRRRRRRRRQMQIAAVEHLAAVPAVPAHAAAASGGSGQWLRRLRRGDLLGGAAAVLAAADAKPAAGAQPAASAEPAASGSAHPAGGQRPAAGQQPVALAKQ
jgi:hypothetical protein